MATVTKPVLLDDTGQNILTQLTRIADAKEANLMGFGGAVLFADLPNPTVSNLGLFYLIKDAFTTDSRFVDGAGISEPAGKYWAVINIGTMASPVCKYAELGTLVDLSAKQDKLLSSPIVVNGITKSYVEDTLTAINSGTGSLADLTTTTKTTLVAAINEAASTGGGADILPPASPTPTEATVVNAIGGAPAAGTDAASAYATQQWSNTLTKRYIYPDPIASGATGIGVWDDSSSPSESTWWSNNGFKIPDNATDVSVNFLFDPAAGEPLTLGGYILDTTTGKLCIKFAKATTVATHKVAVDITYTRNYVN